MRSEEKIRQMLKTLEKWTDHLSLTTELLREEEKTNSSDELMIELSKATFAMCNVHAKSQALKWVLGEEVDL